YIEEGVVFNEITAAMEPQAVQWQWRTDLPASERVSFGNALYGSVNPHPLPQITFPLHMRGWYAIYLVGNPQAGPIRIRLSGDERADQISSRYPYEEVFWAWRNMDRQHLVLKQGHDYRGNIPAHLDYVKFVPLTAEQVAGLESSFGLERDKLVAGYYEPYSWAFYENIQETIQHREPLAAFAEAGIGLLDMQIGRFGMKVVYESRVTDHLIYSTIGDPVPGDPQPTTNNVGRMQQYTNTLETCLRYAKDYGFPIHANFGASNCYPGTPLQGEITKQHPDWLRGSTLRFELPEVREYVFGIWRETLDIGAPGISIDFCRYPETIDSATTCTDFLRSLRQLADEYGPSRGGHIPILIRFPATGVRLSEYFDYETWCQERLVDYLCPSNIQGRHLHFDIAPYKQAVLGTQCKLLPCVDGLYWGQARPGPFLWRIKQLYDAGADGIYIYQADACVLDRPGDRRLVRMLSSSDAVNRWWQNDAELRPLCSKGIYLNYPDGVYHPYERLRIWLEGIPMGEVEMLLDGQLISRYDTPPYTLGTEEYASDNVIPPGEHELLVRAKDGDGWLEERFTIRGEP
ncbi:MAG TPA: hypothetical protein PLZ55_04595, partial [bacterium]|nr:hypothetical protein [bacterium]